MVRSLDFSIPAVAGNVEGLDMTNDSIQTVFKDARKCPIDRASSGMKMGNLETKTSIISQPMRFSKNFGPPPTPKPGIFGHCVQLGAESKKNLTARPIFDVIHYGNPLA